MAEIAIGNDILLSPVGRASFLKEGTQCWMWLPEMGIRGRVTLFSAAGHIIIPDDCIKHECHLSAATLFLLTGGGVVTAFHKPVSIPERGPWRALPILGAVGLQPKEFWEINFIGALARTPENVPFYCQGRTQ